MAKRRSKSQRRGGPPLRLLITQGRSDAQDDPAGEPSPAPALTVVHGPYHPEAADPFPGDGPTPDDRELTEIDLAGVRLSEIDLGRPPDDGSPDGELTDTELTDTELTDTELTDTELTDAELIDTELTDTELTDAELTDAELDVLDLQLDTLDVHSALDGLATMLADAVAGCRRALDAELAICEGLGPVDEAAPDDATDHARQDARAALTVELIARAAGRPRMQSLALLRVLAVLAEPAVRPHAAAAAAELAAQGLPDRPWAAVIGRPLPIRAWRYGDVFGSQESICVMFRYASHEHVVSVLIDHQLGGGVKDVWFSEGRAARSLRSTMAEAMAAEPTCFLEDIGLVRAGGTLRSALSASPCPEQPDQVEDVAAFLPLLRSRTELLPADGPLEMAVPPVKVLRLKVLLKGTKPPIWRRLEVPADVSLADFHRILQAAFGWSGRLPHAFAPTAAGAFYAELDAPLERRLQIDALIGGVGDRLRYWYGDGTAGAGGSAGERWEHLVTVEAVAAFESAAERADAPLGHLRCTGGRRAAPPDGCRGPVDFHRLLARASDPSSSEPSFDPASFDLVALDRAVRETLPHQP